MKPRKVEANRSYLRLRTMLLKAVAPDFLFAGIGSSHRLLRCTSSVNCQTIVCCTIMTTRHPLVCVNTLLANAMRARVFGKPFCLNGSTRHSVAMDFGGRARCKKGSLRTRGFMLCCGKSLKAQRLPRSKFLRWEREIEHNLCSWMLLEDGP